MNPSIYLVAILSLLGCAVDPAESQRDYTLSACPGRVDPVDTAVCDRGVGYEPRFVTLAQCFADFAAEDSSVSSSAHPAHARCRVEARVVIFRWDDVRMTLGR